MAQLIIEELNRLGHVVNRHKIDQFPVSIGRGFDNEVILDDPYVSPNHVTVDKSETGWVINDTDSLNGIIFENKLVGASQQPIETGSEIVIGKTRLRFYAPDHQIAETRHISHGLGFLSKLSQPIPLLIILTVCVVLFVSDMLLTANQKVEFDQGLKEFLPLIVALSIWAAIWAFIGRLIQHQTQYFVHLVIIVIFVTVSQLMDSITQFLEFNFLGGTAIEIFGLVLLGIMLAWLVASHLRYSTRLIRETRLIGAVSFALSVVGFYYLTTHSNQDDFKRMPAYSVVLKPPYAQIVGSKSIDQYLQESQDIFNIEIKK